MPAQEIRQFIADPPVEGEELVRRCGAALNALLAVVDEAAAAARTGDGDGVLVIYPKRLLAHIEAALYPALEEGGTGE